MSYVTDVVHKTVSKFTACSPDVKVKSQRTEYAIDYIDGPACEKVTDPEGVVVCSSEKGGGRYIETSATAVAGAWRDPGI